MLTPAIATALTVGFLAGAGGLGDNSFNDATVMGLRKAKSELGVDLVYEIPKEGEEREGMTRLIGKGAVFIVANGDHYEELVRQSAAAHPEITFLLNDAALDGPNIHSTIFAQRQGSFLAGVLAAMTTKTGVIGFVGGTDSPPVLSFLKGFEEGAAWARPDVTTVARFVMAGNDPHGFDSPREADALAVHMYRQGADILYSVAGASGNGVIHAAKTSGKYVIGVDTDQDSMAKGTVLTSMLKRLDVATFDSIKLFLAGELKTGPRLYDLAGGGVSLSPMTYTRDKIPPDALAKVDEARRLILSGGILIRD